MIKQISDKKRKRLKEQWSEVEIFKEIWNEREHICEICKHPILYPWSWSFAHRLAKSQYPKFRLIKENIALVDSIMCHKKIDSIYVKEKRAEFIEYLTKKYL